MLQVALPLSKTDLVYATTSSHWPLCATESIVQASLHRCIKRRQHIMSLDHGVKLKAAIHHSTRHVAKSIAAEHGLRLDSATIFALGSLADDFIQLIAADAVAFAAHRGVKGVAAKDVKLCARRDPVVARLLNEFEATYAAPKERKARGKRVSSAVGGATTTDMQMET